METKGKSSDTLNMELFESINEQDVMDMRSKLKNIQISIENNLQSYNMNSAEDAGSRE